MSETDASPFDVQQLRRGLRDLAALSALPVVWTESDPRRIAENLADALLHMLHLELVYILVRDRAYESPVEVAHTARGPAPTVQAEEIGRALEPWLKTGDLSSTPSSIPNPVGTGMIRIIGPTFGIEARGGVLVACSPRADFPTEVDRLLLGVAANQVASLLDRRRTEDALRESEERFRGTFENAGVGIADCDVRGHFLRVNQKLCEILGYSREELLQKTWQNITHPDDLAASLEQFLPLLRGEVSGYSLEKRYVRKNGAVVWIDLAVSLRRDAAGAPAYVIAILQDISERKRLEQELSQAHARLELAVRGSNISIVELNIPDGVLQNGRWDWVSAGDQMGGYDRSELATDFATTIARLHPDDRERVIGALRAHLSGQTSEFQAEGRIRHKDGSYLWRLARGVAIRDAEGRAIRFMMSAVDINDLKRAEEALRASEQRFRTFVDHATDAFFLHDERGAILDVNRQACESLGYTRDELLGMTPADFDPDVNPAYFEDIERMLAPGATIAFESRHRRKDGTVFPVEIRGQAFWEGGRRLTVGLARDITDRKRAEQELRQARNDLEMTVAQRTAELQRATAELQTILDASPVGIALFSRDQTVRRCNPAFERILGWTADEIAGRPISVMHANREEWRTLTEMLNRGAAFANVETRLLRKDGSEFAAAISCTPLQAEAGSPTGFVAAVEDISDRKRAEEERQAHLWFFESMDRVNRAIQGTNDLEQMMSDVLDTVLSIFDCDRAFLVYPCDPEAASWQVPMERTRPDYPGLFALGLDIPTDPEVVKVSRIVRASSGPVRFGPGTEHKVPAEVAKRFSIQSQMVMAIYPKVEKPYMFGLHQCSYERAWTPREERLFQEIGRRLADGLTSLLVVRNLRDNEATLEDAQRMAHVGHWSRDLDTNRINWSNEIYRIYGLSPQEPIIDFARFQKLIHPEDWQAWQRAVAEAVRGGPRYDVEYRVVRPDGDVRIVHSQGDLTWDQSGRPRRMFGTLQDITERKRAEEALRQNQQLLQAIFDNASVVIHVKDLDGRYLLVNRRFEAALGRRSDEILGKTDFDIFPEESALRRRELDRRVLEAAAVLETEEVDLLNGSPRWSLQITCPLFAPSGEPYATCGISTDITERRAKEAAEAANRAKDEFLANVSHEIRTPMNAILGMTELALDTPLTEEQREYLSIVKSSADALLKVIHDLLDFAKIEAGKLELDHTDFSLRHVLGETLRALALRAHRKGLELACQIQPEVPDALIGDSGRLRQVLLNLIGNAIKFTEQGEVVVRVEAGLERSLTELDPSVPESQHSQRLHFSITDTGIGIPRDKQEKIFQAFEQGDNSTTRRYEGTGLGLSIASQLVALMGGQITVESEPGRGSTFRFTAEFGLQPHPPSGPHERPLVDLHGLRVLVVDDNATNRQILEEWLRGWHTDPLAVADGFKALEALWRAVSIGRPFALVLLDVRMPGTDGLAVAESILSNPELAATRIILLTSEAQYGDIARYREMGIAAYAMKPVPQDELLEIIYRVLSRPHSADQDRDRANSLATASVSTPGPSAASARRLRILVAEDNPFNQRLVAHLLSRKGHDVRVASDGLEALAALEQESFDLMALDVHMPKCDGFQVIEALRRREQASGGHLPVLALTARATKSDRERCLAAGMDDYLAKPIGAVELFAAIERLLSAHGVPQPIESQAADHAGLINPAVLLAACGDDADGLRRICEGFRSYVPSQLAEVGDALRAQDAPRLREAAHKLCGLLSAISTVAGAVASKLEDQAASGRGEECHRLVEQLEAIARELFDQVDGLSIETLRHQAMSAGDSKPSVAP
jgi:two-component system, sensor histidine kinase and response regulator